MWKIASMAAMRQTNKPSNGKSSPVTIMIVVVILGAVILFGSQFYKMFVGLLENFGLVNDKHDKSVEDEIYNGSKPGSPWNSQTWKSRNGGQKPMYYDAADKIVKDIWDAFGAFNDYESQAIGAIKKLTSQSQVSFVADRFYAYHKADLLTWLRGESYPNDRLGNEDLNVIIKFVKNLPK